MVVEISIQPSNDQFQVDKTQARKVSDWANNLMREDVFGTLDKDKNGFVKADEASDASKVHDPITNEAPFRYDVLADYQKQLQLSPSFDRWWNSIDGVSKDDLKELQRRATDLPKNLELSSKIEPVFNKYFEMFRGGNTGLRKSRMDTLLNYSRLSPDEKEVLTYLKDNWRDFKHDIGNQLNRDEAIMPNELSANVRKHVERLRKDYEIVEKIGTKL